jgi:hypothetical protein
VVTGILCQPRKKKQSNDILQKNRLIDAKPNYTLQTGHDDFQPQLKCQHFGEVNYNVYKV